MIVNSFKKLTKKNPILRIILYPAYYVRRLFSLKKKKCQKQIIQNFGELLHKDPIFKIEEFGGVFSLDPRSDIFSRFVQFKEYEPKLVKIVLNFLDRDRDAIDIGANIGLFTVLFGNQLEKGTVFSVEPSTRAKKRLYQNIEMNNIEKQVTVYEGVVSNISGISELKTIEGMEEYSSLGDMKHAAIVDESFSVEKVNSITLDELVKGNSINPGFIKVDVEGMEHLVFEGAHSVLKEKRPIILSELSDYLLKQNGSSSMFVIDLIKSFDYDIFDPIDPFLEPGTKDYGDIICFPKEMKLTRKSIENI